VTFYAQKGKGKGIWICIAPHCEKLASEALRYGTHSFYTANSPYLPRHSQFLWGRALYYRRSNYWWWPLVLTGKLFIIYTAETKNTR